MGIKGKFIEDLKVFSGYFDFVQVIEPLETKANSSNSRKRQNDKEDCFCLSHGGEKCKCCIALKATELNETLFNIVQLHGDVFMVIAMPVHFGQELVAIELVKCINNQSVERLLQELKDNNHDAFANLHNLANMDELTNIYNRRYIANTLPVEMGTTRMNQQPLSLVMADIDHFKKVNDQYGHGVGDEILIAFADVISKYIRKNGRDCVARYGGEEFLIFLTNCQECEAYEVAERMRIHVEKTVAETTAGHISITASFGVHTFNGEDVNMQQLLSIVDKYLYLAKQAGRNCTMSRNAVR